VVSAATAATATAKPEPADETLIGFETERERLSAHTPKLPRSDRENIHLRAELAPDTRSRHSVAVAVAGDSRLVLGIEGPSRRYRMGPKCVCTE
jgi:hypothetical protein